MYGKPLYQRLPQAVSLESGFEAQLQALCGRGGGEFRVALPPETAMSHTLCLTRERLTLRGGGVLDRSVALSWEYGVSMTVAIEHWARREIAISVDETSRRTERNSVTVTPQGEEERDLIVLTLRYLIATTDHR